MTPSKHSLFLIPVVLAAFLLFALSMQQGGSEPQTQNSFVQILNEAQRAEALAHLEQSNQESLTALHAIVRQLIDGKLPLEEALDAYAEVYSQLYFVRGWIAEGKVKPLTREGAFEQVLGYIEAELKSDPSRARLVREHVREEWDCLHTHRAHGREPL